MDAMYPSGASVNICMGYTLEHTWDILEVEKLSVHPPNPYRLNRNNNYGSTCQTVTG